MWLKLCTAIAFLLATHVQANDLFKQADIKAGKTLTDKHCVSCHAASFGGDGSEIYTREYRKVTTASGLLTQVRQCSTRLNLKWFDEEELNAAGYLNHAYYHFK